MLTFPSEKPRTARGGVQREVAVGVVMALLGLIMRELPALLRAHATYLSPWPRTIAYGLAGVVCFGLLSGWVDRDPWPRAGLVALIVGSAMAAIGWWST